MNKFQPEGVDLAIWFEDISKQHVSRRFKLETIEYVVYKGFKIVKSLSPFPTNKDYFIYSVTGSLLDNPVPQHHLKMMKEEGVVKAIDVIAMSRLKKHLKNTNDELARINQEIDNGSTKEFYMKRSKELLLDIATLELKIKSTINKYKLNGK